MTVPNSVAIRMVAAIVLVVGLAGVTVAIVRAGNVDQSVAVAGGSTTPSTIQTVTAPTTEPEPQTTDPVCSTPELPQPLEAYVETLVDAYNRRDAGAIVGVIGQGSVTDSSLQLGQQDSYGTIEEWISEVERVGDVLEVQGIGGQGFKLFASRSNSAFEASGIEALSFTLEISSSDSCESRIRTTSEISSPDACTYQQVVGVIANSGCADNFEPRMGHLSAWTGDELLILGGSAGTGGDALLTSGLGRSEEGWRDIAPLPVRLNTWPGVATRWVGDRLVVAGSTSEGVQVLSYFPVEDRWDVSDPLPADRYGPGAVVITDAEVVIAGGSNNDPRDTAWIYDLADQTWEQLADPPFQPVENMSGVWTGTEALFIGGYSRSSKSPAVAFDPATRQWRSLAPMPGHWLEPDQLVWTSEVVIVVGGNSGPAHPTELSVYDPGADVWTLTAPLPIQAVEDLAVGWTGTELLLWGGFGTYNQGVSGEGAVYDIATDSWRVMAASPLTARCYHSGEVTRDGFVIFGGLEVCGDPGILARGDGAIYDPESDTWSVLSNS